MGNIDKSGTEIGGCQKLAYPDFMGCSRELLLLLYWRCYFAVCSYQGYSKTAFIKCLLWKCSFRTIFQATLSARPFLHKHFCIECVLVQLTTCINKEKDGSRLLVDFKLLSWFCPPGNSFFLVWQFFIFLLSTVINAYC